MVGFCFLLSFISSGHLVQTMWLQMDEVSKDALGRTGGDGEGGSWGRSESRSSQYGVPATRSARQSCTWSRAGLLCALSGGGCCKGVLPQPSPALTGRWLVGGVSRIVSSSQAGGLLIVKPTHCLQTIYSLGLNYYYLYIS